MYTLNANTKSNQTRIQKEAAAADVQKKKMEVAGASATVLQTAVRSKKAGGEGVLLTKTHVKFDNDEDEPEGEKVIAPFAQVCGNMLLCVSLYLFVVWCVLEEFCR